MTDEQLAEIRLHFVRDQVRPIEVGHLLDEVYRLRGIIAEYEKDKLEKSEAAVKLTALYPCPVCSKEMADRGVMYRHCGNCGDYYV